MEVTSVPLAVEHGQTLQWREGWMERRRSTSKQQPSHEQNQWQSWEEQEEMHSGVLNGAWIELIFLDKEDCVSLSHSKPMNCWNQNQSKRDLPTWEEKERGFISSFYSVLIQFQFFIWIFAGFKHLSIVMVSWSCPSNRYEQTLLNCWVLQVKFWESSHCFVLTKLSLLSLWPI